MPVDAGVKDGKLPSGKAATREVILALVNKGRDAMPSFKEILSEQEFKTFKDALDRRPSAGLVGTGSSAPAGLERRLDRLQKEIEDLRRELRR